jgi:hypothetical protein
MSSQIHDHDHAVALGTRGAARRIEMNARRARTTAGSKRRGLTLPQLTRMIELQAHGLTDCATAVVLSVDFNQSVTKSQVRHARLKVVPAVPLLAKLHAEVEAMLGSGVGSASGEAG